MSASKKKKRFDNGYEVTFVQTQKQVRIVSFIRGTLFLIISTICPVPQCVFVINGKKTCCFQTAKKKATKKRGSLSFLIAFPQWGIDRKRRLTSFN